MQKSRPFARLPIVDEIKATPPKAYLLIAWEFLSGYLPRMHADIMASAEFIVTSRSPVVINRHNYARYAN
jgi:hypothetical protein